MQGLLPCGFKGMPGEEGDDASDLLDAMEGTARYTRLYGKMVGKKAIKSVLIFVEECGLTSLLTQDQFLKEREHAPGALFLLHA